MFCPKCGTQAPNQSTYCYACGEKLPVIQTTPPKPRRQYPPTTPYPQTTTRSGYSQTNAVNKSAPPRTQEPKPKVYPQSHNEMKKEKEQVPDPTFSRFVDALDPPLPFWKMKVAITVMTVLCIAWVVFCAVKMETLLLLSNGVRENVPGIPFLIMALTWAVSAVCSALSKTSKGAAGAGAVGYFFAAGTAFTARAAYQDAGMLILAMASVVFAIVLLISAAGGITINFEEGI